MSSANKTPSSACVTSDEAQYCAWTKIRNTWTCYRVGSDLFWHKRFKHLSKSVANQIERERDHSRMASSIVFHHIHLWLWRSARLLLRQTCTKRASSSSVTQLLLSISLSTSLFVCISLFLYRFIVLFSTSMRKFVQLESLEFIIFFLQLRMVEDIY